MVCRALALALTAVLFAPAGPLVAEGPKLEWGNLSATFIYDGEPPARRELPIDKDEFLVKKPFLSEWLIVDPKSKGIANVVVWIAIEPTGKPPLVHDSYADLAKKTVTIEARSAQIQPHVATAWTRQALLIKNSDPVGHNLSSTMLGFPILPAIGEGEIQLKAPINQPARINCTIHPWMSGYILVQNHPYFAVSDTDGKVAIKNLPVGNHTFAVWQESVGFVKEVERSGKRVKWRMGRISVEIKPGENDLGEIRIKPDQFK